MNAAIDGGARYYAEQYACDRCGKTNSIGGDNHVARTIADAIERGAHWQSPPR